MAKAILYKVSGYEEAIMALRMSKGKFYSEDKAREIQNLVYVVTDRQGLICTEYEYEQKLPTINQFIGKISFDYATDVKEFKRLLGLTMDNAMGTHKHHTLMKYIEISFFTEGMHRGAQDDLDAHAIAFNNRITRYSTRLADIEDTPLSDWYKDKVMTFHEAMSQINPEVKWGESIHQLMPLMPDTIMKDGEEYHRTPWGYVIAKHAQVPAKNGLSKDVQRGLMPLGMESNAIWKIDLANLRYVYSMRSKFTKANPELKKVMEQLADQVEQIPVFGEHFRHVLTDSGEWEHISKVKEISFDEYQEFKKWKKECGF